MRTSALGAQAATCCSARVEVKLVGLKKKKKKTSVNYEYDRFEMYATLHRRTHQVFSLSVTT